ncbi:uncharacterized protein B0H18DRAFT_1198164 [Fomitopsis serialis]|uniref:uncharacterized protein n=1 Tax=Fomitopsis serialis TaxID=139415 RepID=UPI002008C7B6|nr:uncharacterized protein B0H18DRAFT_1198164 [Neoantrodia serialis]KAH9918865.1 hypothetical protein B0H18DRAFT_1198164 [Neoantrodia serialis]
MSDQTGALCALSSASSGHCDIPHDPLVPSSSMSRTAAQTFRRRSTLCRYHAKHPSMTNTTSGPRRLSEGTLAFGTDFDSSTTHRNSPCPFPKKKENNIKGGLEDYEREDEGRYPFLLNSRECTLLGIAGVGFFLDASDLFIINVHLSSDREVSCDLSATGSIIWHSIWHIILGIGIGGDCPMSASVATDRSSLRRRDTLLSYIFASQGWGSLIRSLMVIIVVAFFHHIMEVKGETSKVDSVWRSLVPAFGTLYQRLTPRLAAKTDADLGAQESVRPAPASSETPSPTSLSPAPSANAAAAVHAQPATKRDHWAEFFHHFSEWRHLKVLLGTCAYWFLFDIAFHGINLTELEVLRTATPSSPHVQLTHRLDGTANVLWILACCIVGAGFTLLLPEVKGYDSDLVYAEEVTEEE